MNEKLIILKSSHTYSISNYLFPKHIRDDISILYAFLRFVDNLVDYHPQRVDTFYKVKDFIFNNIDFEMRYLEARIINSFLGLMNKIKIEKAWLEAFFKSMEYDLYKTNYTYKELLDYMYGSAEIVGMIIARIINLPDSKLYGARLLGRGMQMINFIRDIYEDLGLNRIYIPKEHLELYEANINRFDNKMKDLVRFELKLAWTWIETSKTYLRDISKIYSTAIITATELYQWIGKSIYNNPEIITRKKIKPGYTRALFYAIKNKISH